MTPEQLLFADDDAEVVGLDEVAFAGLDRHYAERRPALRELLRTGTSAHQLHAANLLAAWGDRHGLVAIIDWASDPHSVPWAAVPTRWWS